eukprot:GHVS01081212.1.p2 GENE.GHVS01081212.1~~GHVS01081212.1.p2  ORF type:complete len:647 (-),score=123.61 GHVS01081212.1:2553-4493(-)
MVLSSAAPPRPFSAYPSISSSPHPSQMPPTPSTCPPTSSPFSSPSPSLTSPFISCSCTSKVASLSQKVTLQQIQIRLLHKFAEMVVGAMPELINSRRLLDNVARLERKCSSAEMLAAAPEVVAVHVLASMAATEETNRKQATVVEDSSGDAAPRERTKRKAEQASEHSGDQRRQRKHYKAADAPQPVESLTSKQPLTNPSDIICSPESAGGCSQSPFTPCSATTTSPLPSSLTRRPRSPGHHNARSGPPTIGAPTIGPLSDRFASLANVKASFMIPGPGEKRKRERDDQRAGGDAEEAGESGGGASPGWKDSLSVQTRSEGQTAGGEPASAGRQQRLLLGTNKIDEAAVVLSREKTPMRFPLSSSVPLIDPPHELAECSSSHCDPGGTCSRCTMLGSPGRRTLLDGGVHNYHKVLIAAPPFTPPRQPPLLVAALEKFICAPLEQHKKRIGLDATAEDKAAAQVNLDEASWLVEHETRVDELDQRVESGEGVDMFSVFGRPSPLELAHSFSVEMYWRLQENEKAKSQVYKTLKSNGFDVCAMARGPEASTLFASVLRTEEDRLRHLNGKVDWRREPMLEENINWVNKATGRLQNWEDKVMKKDRCFCPTPDPSKKWQWNFSKYKRWAGNDEDVGLGALEEEDSQSRL